MEINDFGFTAVDQEELVTKTGDAAGIGEKVDLLQKLISNALGELEDHKDNLVAIDTKKELDYKDRLLECEKLILPLLQNLMKNEEKEYIYWPNRKAIISSQIDRIRKVTKI